MKNGECATSYDVARGACGEAPNYEKCTHECTPLHKNCKRGALPDAGASSTRIDNGLELFELTGEDSKGNRAAFDIIMISDGLTWKYKSEEVEQGKQSITAAALRKILKNRFATATDIIASGTASAEGPRRSEEARALKRGAKLAEMAAEEARPGSALWILNLGQYLARCTNCGPTESSFQRPVFIIGVVHKENDDVNLGEALRMALGRRPGLPQPERYSLFDLQRRR